MQNQQWFEAPFVSEISTNYCPQCSRSGAGRCKCKRSQGSDFESLFEFEDLTREQMAKFVRDKWNRNPILRQVAKAQRMRGQAQHRELMRILRNFQRITGIKVEIVPQGTVQRLTKRPGNFSSLRSRPGFLQIEEQVLQKTSQFLKEVRHELAYYYAGGPGKVPTFKNTPFNALVLLEMMIQGDGKLPPPIAPLSPDREFESEQEQVEHESNRNHWFWRTSEETASAIRSAIANLRNQKVLDAKNALVMARHRTLLTKKALRQLKLANPGLVELALDAVLGNVKQAQKYLLDRNDRKVNIAAVTELEKASKALAHAQRIARARGGIKVWN